MAADQQDDLRATHGPELYSSYLPLTAPLGGLQADEEEPPLDSEADPPCPNPE